MYLKFFIEGLFPSVVTSILTAYFFSSLNSIRTKGTIAGQYKVFIFDPQKAGYVDFCIVVVKTSISENKMKFFGYELADTKLKKVFLKGEGALSNLRFISGHYWKSNDSLEHRFGSFLYELDATGVFFEGQFVYVDQSSKMIKCEKACWRKI